MITLIKINLNIKYIVYHLAIKCKQFGCLFKKPFKGNSMNKKVISLVLNILKYVITALLGYFGGNAL